MTNFLDRLKGWRGGNGSGDSSDDGERSAGRLSALAEMLGAKLNQPTTTLTLTIEHGFVKLLATESLRTVDYRIALANPQFFREGMVNDSRRVADVLNRNHQEMDTDTSRLLGAVPGYQTTLGRIDMPKASDMNPAVFLPREAQRTMGITADTSFLGWHSLPDSFDRTRWIVVSATRRSIASMLETAAVARMPQPNLELRAFALARAVNRPEAIIAWTAMDGCDVVIVRDSVPMLNQSAYWGADPVDSSVLVNRLTEVVGRTIAVYDEQSLDLPLTASTPLFVSGSPAALDRSIAEQVGASLRRPVEPVVTPMDLPPGFPVDDLIVNIGLALWMD